MPKFTVARATRSAKAPPNQSSVVINLSRRVERTVDTVAERLAAALRVACSIPVLDLVVCVRDYKFYTGSNLNQGKEGKYGVCFFRF